jgi:protein O-GlcNAc transferase
MSDDLHRETQHSQDTRRGISKWAADKLSVLISRFYFRGSAAYWDRRYRVRGSSGAGSYGAEAEFKADCINQFIAENSVGSVVDFGCGDGAQLTLLRLPAYIGIDVSDHAVRMCRDRFLSDDSKKFLPLAEYSGQTAEAALSLDVVYHLVEDCVFEGYMDRLFSAAQRFVIIYSTDFCGEWPSKSAHVRHRGISDYCARKYPHFSQLRELTAAFGEPPEMRCFLVFKRA